MKRLELQDFILPKGTKIRFVDEIEGIKTYREAILGKSMLVTSKNNIPNIMIDTNKSKNILNEKDDRKKAYKLKQLDRTENSFLIKRFGKTKGE
jgi:hypothetical protein